MRFILAFAVVFSLASCASISKEECISGNWEEIGFRDGTNGQYQSYLQQHAKICSKVQVTPDPVAWEKGRKRGLPAYCVPQKAYDLGRDGWSMNSVCPASQMPALQAANAKGKRYHDLTDEINEAERQIYANENQLTKEKDEAKRRLLISDSRRLRSDIRLLELRRMAFDSL